MSGVIYKFNRDMLRGQKLHVQKGYTAHNYSKHWHSYYEIVCYRGFQGSSVLNGEVYPVTESCLFFLTPKDFHSLQMTGKPGAVNYIISFSEQMISDTIFSEVTEGPVYIKQLPDWLANQIEHLHRTCLRKSPHRSEQLYHLFNGMLIDILEQGSSLSHTTADINPIIRESISLMLADPAGDFSLAGFSQRFNVSTTYFSRLFHEIAGIAFKQYLTMLRVEHAKRLLEEKKLPIIDVGSECGFNTPSQFIRAFKQTTGMTPSEYRTVALQNR